LTEPAATTKLTGIEACRGVAATAVVFYHAARHLNKVYGVPALMSVFQFGHAGVDLFFVVSGFIILFVHYGDIGRPERLGRYLGRRFTRIMPTYWVALALTLLLSLGGGHEFPPLFDVAWSASLLPSHDEPLLGVAWTLQYEIVFYAVFCLLILNRMVGITVLSLWLAWIVAAAKFGSFAGGVIPHSLYGMCNLEFFFGMAVAYWLKNHAVLMPRLILTAGTALFVAAAIAEDIRLMDGYVDMGRLVYGPAAALIVLGAAAADRQSLVTVPSLLRTLGTASYSIYLFQFVFIGVLWKLWLAAGLDETLPHMASFPLLALAGVAGGVVVSRLVEYPLMRLVRRSRRPALAAAVT
jgi:exopolysaccharide production protein ExoZ